LLKRETKRDFYEAIHVPIIKALIYMGIFSPSVFPAMRKLFIALKKGGFSLLGGPCWCDLLRCTLSFKQVPDAGRVKAQCP